MPVLLACLGREGGVLVHHRRAVTPLARAGRRGEGGVGMSDAGVRRRQEVAAAPYVCAGREGRGARSGFRRGGPIAPNGGLAIAGQHGREGRGGGALRR